MGSQRVGHDWTTELNWLRRCTNTPAVMYRVASSLDRCVWGGGWGARASTWRVFRGSPSHLVSLCCSEAWAGSVVDDERGTGGKGILWKGNTLWKSWLLKHLLVKEQLAFQIWNFRTHWWDVMGERKRRKSGKEGPCEIRCWGTGTLSSSLWELLRGFDQGSEGSPWHWSIRGW